MDSTRDIIENNPLRRNVYVENNINDTNNVYNDDIASKINDAIDKPKAIGKIIADELGAPSNIKLYIKLVYQYPQEVLFECLALTKQANRDGRIRTTKAQYFYGIIKNKKKL